MVASKGSRVNISNYSKKEPCTRSFFRISSQKSSFLFPRGFILATYVVGDIQGCFSSLTALIEHIEFDSTQDRLWCVGDLVNRGPESLSVLRFVKSLGSRAVTVLGNHDLHLLAVHAGIAELQAKDTIQEVLDAPDCDELMLWLRHQPMIYRENQFLLVHAGILPQWSTQEALERAQEVETGLRAIDYQSPLQAMYRCNITQWQDHFSLDKQLGFTTNVFTRMRVCSPTGNIDLKFTGPPDDIPQGFSAWYDIPPQTPRQETILFGHWSALGLKILDHCIGLDEGCVWGRKLAAIRLEDRKIFEISCSG